MKSILSSIFASICRFGFTLKGITDADQAFDANNLIAVKPFSDHPDDWYLTVVCYKSFSKEGEFNVHLHNSQDDGFHEGGYHRTLSDALTDFQSRGRIHGAANVPQSTERYGEVVGRDLSINVISRYLPGNYCVVRAKVSTPDGEWIVSADQADRFIDQGLTLESVLIAGRDNAGWTFDDYIAPRLASGLYSCRELKRLPQVDPNVPPVVVEV